MPLKRYRAVRRIGIMIPASYPFARWSRALQGRRYRGPPFIDIAPDTVLAEIAFGIKMYEEDIRGIEMDLIVFDNIKKFKRWLKEMKHRQADGAFDEMPF